MFRDFTTNYPRRAGSRGVAKGHICYDKLVASGQTTETELDQCAFNYNDETKDLEGKDRQYIQMMPTFLGPQETWQDFRPSAFTGAFYIYKGSAAWNEWRNWFLQNGSSVDFMDTQDKWLVPTLLPGKAA